MNTAEASTLMICITVVISMILMIIDDYIKIKLDRW